MPDKIPYEKAEKFARENECKVVVILAWDGSNSHVVTWGESAEQSDFAADTGHQMRCVLNWKDNMYVDSSKVKALKDEIESLKKQISSLKDQIPNPERDRQREEDHAHLGWYNGNY